MTTFVGKVAIVTGAGSGIGAAIAKELSRLGASVVAADIDLAAAEKTASDIAGALGKVRAVQVDVADAGSVEKLTDYVIETFGGLHLAVNNAGIGGPSVPTAEYAIGDWKRILDVNLNGVFYGMKFQIPAMLASGGGAIVNMSSILGTVGWSNACAYVASKHAVIGLSKTAALEYAPHIRVNAVCPAFIDTPLLVKNLDVETIEKLAGLHPAGRLGTCEDVSALTCFLLSDEARFITGSSHLVDGGYTSR
jgi:NAD(P)-dependent dehydrogenase (short-subunit alcohol dehydrogenase family)